MKKQFTRCSAALERWFQVFVVCVVAAICSHATAAAQSVPFLSNLDQAGPIGIGVQGLTGYQRKQLITGQNPEGYVLDSVRLEASKFMGTGDLLIYLFSDNNNSLGSQLVRLTGANPSGVGIFEFTAPAGVWLSPSTKYWIAATASGDAAYGWHRTTNAAPTFSATDGWLFLRDVSSNSTPLALEVNAWAAGRSSQYAQDFSSAALGATSFGDGSTLFSTALGSVASIQDGNTKELQLTINGANNTRSAFLLPDLDPGQPIFAFSAKWNSQLNANFPNGGNGFSFNFGQLAGVDLISTAVAQESGYTNGLSFSVETSGNLPGFFLRVGGVTYASKPFTASTQFGVNSTTRHFFEVDWHHSYGLTVRMDGQPIFTNVTTFGFVPQAGDRFAWAARTSTLAEEMRLDNIVVMTGGNLERVPVATPYYTSAGSLEPQFAFDGSFVSGNCCSWIDYSPPTGQIGGTLPARRNPAVYALTSGSPARNSDPSQWILEGSTNAGASWFACGVNNGYFINQDETRCWVTTNAASYNAVRLNITANRGSATAVSLGELTMYKFAPVVNPWVPANLPVGNYSVASSADGTKLAAAANNGQVYRSLNSGAGWFQTLVGSNAWFDICSTADGEQMTVATYPGTLVTFASFRRESAQPAAYWRDVSCSSDGNTIAAAGPYLYTSTDGGVSWIQRTFTLLSWNGVAVSADGSRMAAALNGGHMWTSTNSGATWQETTSPSKPWKNVASSSSGTKLYASTFGETVYRSLDSGATWTATTLPNDYYDVAASADGNIVVAVGDGGVFVSFDSGARWWNVGAPAGQWRRVAISADGSRLIASTFSGTVWVYNLFTMPTIATAPATSVAQHSATMNAQVNTHGVAATVFFSYGTTTNYFNTVSTNLPGVEASVLVPMQLPGLSPGTTYHYRAGAMHNAAGIFRWGDDQTFTTLGLAPTLIYGPTLVNGSLFVQFAGAANSTYTIEATTIIAPATWQKLMNITTGPDGIISVQTGVTTPATRFFRTVQPAY